MSYLHPSSPEVYPEQNEKMHIILFGKNDAGQTSLYDLLTYDNDEAFALEMRIYNMAGPSYQQSLEKVLELVTKLGIYSEDRASPILLLMVVKKENALTPDVTQCYRDINTFFNSSIPIVFVISGFDFYNFDPQTFIADPVMVHLETCKIQFAKVLPACLADISQLAIPEVVKGHLTKRREKTKADVVEQIKFQCDVAACQIQLNNPTFIDGHLGGAGNTAGAAINTTNPFSNGYAIPSGGGGRRTIPSVSPDVLTGYMDSPRSSYRSSQFDHLELKPPQDPDALSEVWSEDSESTTATKTSRMSKFTARFLGSSKIKTEIIHGGDTNAVRNIIIFGETGTGKSSTINLLTGKDIAEIARGARACTKFPKDYILPGVRENETYQLYDTGGFSEGPEGLLSYKDAKAALYTLVKQLSTKNEDGLRLAILVLKKGRPLSATAVQCYRDFNRFCEKRVPIILLMTHFDFDDDLPTSIGKEMVAFQNSRMNFVSAIAGCAGNPDMFSGQQQIHINKRRDQTRSHIIEQIKIHTNNIGWKKEDSKCKVT